MSRPASEATDIHKLGLVAVNPARDELLYELATRGEIAAEPGTFMDIDGLVDPQNLPSLLYWMGMLTLGHETGLLRIPNYAIARLYWEQALQIAGRDAGVLSVGPIREALRALMKTGEGEPVFRLALDLVLSKLSNRDLLRVGKPQGLRRSGPDPEPSGYGLPAWLDDRAEVPEKGRRQRGGASAVPG